MNKLKREIIQLVNQIYQEKHYPELSDFIVKEYIASDISESISQTCNTNTELKKCEDCDYCYQIAISESKQIPIIPDYSKNNNRRRLWIKKFGKSHYQMYIAMSKLGKYAMIYWTKYGRYLLFYGRINHKYTIPSNRWEELFNCIKLLLQKKNIELVSPDLVHTSLDVKYKGKIEGVDNKPSLKKLLFTEELH